MTTRRPIATTGIALAAAALLCLVAAPAAAAESDPTTWQVQPTGPDGPGSRAYFVLEAEPGATLHDMVAITNLSENEISMRVFGSDAFNAASGEFDLLATSEVPDDVGAWTTIDPETVGADGMVTIPARSRLNLPFSIRIPANATPGDHVGGVVTSIASIRTAESGEQVLVDARVAARIYLTVRGELEPRLQVGSVRAERTGSWWNPFDGEVTVNWTVTNTGNLRLGGAQEVSIGGPFGIGTTTVTGPELPEILPGSSVEQTVSVPGVSALLLLTINGTVNPLDDTGRVLGALDPVHFSATLAAIPWPTIGAVVLLVLGGWLLIRTLLRRRAAVVALHEELAALRQHADGSHAAEGAAAGDAAADTAVGTETDAETDAVIETK